jgi:hypothetical protein
MVSTDQDDVLENLASVNTNIKNKHRKVKKDSSLAKELLESVESQPKSRPISVRVPDEIYDFLVLEARNKNTTVSMLSGKLLGSLLKPYINELNENAEPSL